MWHVRGMSIHLTEHEIKTALSSWYGMEPDSLALLNGFYDKNYLVKVGRESFFLKIYGFDKLPAIRFQLSFIDACVKAGLPMAAVMPTRTGKSFFAVGDHYGSLQVCLSGKQLRLGRLTTGMMEEVGGILGKIHKLTKGKTFPGKNWKKYPWDLSQFDLVIRDFRKVRERLPENLASLIEGVVADWNSHAVELKKMRKGIIHGDYHGGNILVAKGACSGVVDFGDAMRGWYAGDVAIALAHVCFKGKGDPKDFMRAFLVGYSNHFRLNALETNALPLLIRMRAATAIVEIVDASKHNEQELYGKMFKEQMAVLQYLEGQKLRWQK